jgi:hypothetical protein
VVVRFFHPTVATIWWSVFWVPIGLTIVEILARAVPRKPLAEPLPAG